MELTNPAGRKGNASKVFAPSTMARYPGVCTKTTSGRAHIASSVTGVAAIPADSSLADWPLSYADLEPYYDRAEYELGVSGKAGNVQGRKIDGATCSKPLVIASILCPRCSTIKRASGSTP